MGSALDNTAAESFFSALEFECLRKHRFATKAEARRAVAGYIDRYNRIRRHSSCQMKSPVDYEAILAAGRNDRVIRGGTNGQGRGPTAPGLSFWATIERGGDRGIGHSRPGGLARDRADP
ncbi:MAG: integrase core domain-containing protein [Actinomycetota bacterium]|nr:integrase core domain-containing protein [Actinomycetota bacterium]